MVLILGIETTISAAGDPTVTPLSPPQTLMVKNDRAVVMAGDNQHATAPLGTVIVSTFARGPWRFSPELKGWLHDTDLIPLDQAVTRFSEDIAKEPTPRAYHLRGIAWMARREFAKAVQDLEEAYELGDSAVSLHYNLGLCYLELGHEDAASKEFDSILETYPDEAPARLARGKILLKNGQFTEALRDFEKGAELQQGSNEVFNLQGVTLRMLGRYEDAIDAYSKAIEIDPKDAEATSNRAYARKSLNQDQAALEDYDAALKLLPDSPEIQNDLAWLLATSPDESVRQPERALKLAEAAWEQSGRKNPEYADTLAAAYARLGQFDAAIEAASLALVQLKELPGASPVQERLTLYREKKPFTETRPQPEPETPAAEAPATP